MDLELWQLIIAVVSGVFSLGVTGYSVFSSWFNTLKNDFNIKHQKSAERICSLENQIRELQQQVAVQIAEQKGFNQITEREIEDIKEDQTRKHAESVRTLNDLTGFLAARAGYGFRTADRGSDQGGYPCAGKQT